MPLLLSALSLSVPVAFAGSVFASVDPETTIGRGGTWSRVHANADGWWFFQGSGGDMWTEDITLELGDYDDRGRTQLTDNGTLQDMQVERCDDGGWLVAGSATLEAFDDSAYAWRSDLAFSPLGTVTIEEREEARAHNDMTILCSSVATGVAYANTGGQVGSTFFDIDGVTLGERHTVPAFNAMGGSLSVRPSDGRIVGADTEGPSSTRVRLTVFEPDWSVVEQVFVEVPEGAAFWPQRLLPFGDGWILAYLTRPDGGGGGNDGEVWVMAMDAAFNLVDSAQVSAEGTPNGRPWVARNGTVLAVSYDRDLQPRITLVRLQTDAVPGEDGLPDTGPGDDDDAGDSGSDSGAGGGAGGADCGCASGSVGAGRTGWLALAGVGLVRRRRRAGSEFWGTMGGCCSSPSPA